MSVFLFISGTAILFHINTLNQLDSDQDKSHELVNDFLKPFISGKDPVNFLLLVGDKEEANTDTILLVNFNPSTDKLNILSIPRDTRVNISGLKIPKINSLYARKNGEKLLVDTLNEMFGVNIRYYIYLNISTFRKIIDLLGGVEINVPVNMDYDDPTQNLHIHLKKGKQRLDGKKAEQFLRFRHPNADGYTKEIAKYYDGSDIKRIEAQQYFIKELIRQKANLLYLPKLNSIINTVYDNLETNITLNEVTKLVKNITDFSMESVSMFTLPGKSQKVGSIWYYAVDRQKAGEIIKENFYSKGAFANNPGGSSKKANNTDTGKHNDSSSGKKTGTTSPAKPKEETSVVKDNPSNSETSVEGSEVPAP